MLKFVSKVSIGFSPVSLEAKSARVVTDKNKMSNPKCVIDIQVSDAILKPFVSITYTDKKELKMFTSTYETKEITKDFMRHSKLLQIEEDIKNMS